MVSFVDSHTNATRIEWHLWEIVLRFAPGLLSGWVDEGDARFMQEALQEAGKGAGKTFPNPAGTHKTPNLKPKTRNPLTSTQNFRPSILNPQPYTLNPRLQTLNAKR